MKAGVERVQGHLHRVERITEIEHLQVKSGVFVPGEANESRLPLLLGLIKRLEHATFGVSKLRVVVVDDSMNLPEIEMIGAEPAQRLFEHLQCQSAAAPMSADFGH